MSQFRISTTGFGGALILALLVLTGCAHDPALYQTTVLDETMPKNRFYPKAALGLADIKSFDIAVDKQFVHAVIAGNVKKGGALSVYYLRSEDGGRHWLKPVPIGHGALAPIASRGNDIQIAASGEHLVILWQTSGEFPHQGPLTGVYSSDAGKTWLISQNPAANNAGDQAHLDLVADQQGNFHVVWLEDPEEHGFQSVRYARSLDGGAHWEKASTLDDSTCSCCWNRLISLDSGELNLLYRDMEPRDMGLIQSKDQGANWHRVSTVGAFNWRFEGCPHIGGGLAESQTNVLHSVVWTGLEKQQGLYYLGSKNNGVSWSVPKKFGNNAQHGDIAAIDAQHLVAIWDEMGSDGSYIVYARSDNAGTTWTAPISLSKTDEVASHPRAIKTSEGLLLLWTEQPFKQPLQWSMLLLESR